MSVGAKSQVDKLTLDTLVVSIRTANNDASRKRSKSPSKSKHHWKISNKSATDSAKKKLRISPPLPTRPAQPLFQHRLLESDPDLNSTTAPPVKAKKPIPHSQLAMPQMTSLDDTLSGCRLADLPPDKRGTAFERIHPDGWDKILPKEWVVDELSDNGDKEDIRSAYSQDYNKEREEGGSAHTIRDQRQDHRQSSQATDQGADHGDRLSSDQASSNLRSPVSPQRGKVSKFNGSDPCLSRLLPYPRTKPYDLFQTQQSPSTLNQNGDQLWSRRPLYIFGEGSAPPMDVEGNNHNGLTSKFLHEHHHPLSPPPLRPREPAKQDGCRQASPPTGTSAKKCLPHTQSRSDPKSDVVVKETAKKKENQSLQSSWLSIICTSEDEENPGDPNSGPNPDPDRGPGGRHGYDVELAQCPHKDKDYLVTRIDEILDLYLRDTADEETETDTDTDVQAKVSDLLHHTSQPGCRFRARRAKGIFQNHVSSELLTGQAAGARDSHVGIGGDKNMDTEKARVSRRTSEMGREWENKLRDDWVPSDVVTAPDSHGWTWI
ncbi:uncharacterized protein Z518_03717 [Rhinocladiella mackenziei CBS 650.93]|uniref:Uncharacterized protein n=1 Tax=Rhinocladiella mackenziei CBS 650.93 TaxID=1442369 RepID=A0A0D2J9F2_9EURO|nr:uncharacterized protein Z518_03717 [Rhinocladiella mackenziei CBS 650.93]KIX05745.1 hypothetical protein Z518_03717 [Rhinocladiella mackenziei CBS 650.93]